MSSLPPGARDDVGAVAIPRDGAGAEHSTLTRAIVLGAALIAIAGFIALGTWQVQRRTWKLDLIAATEQRVHAPPDQAPMPDAWTTVTTQKDAYRHVTVTGTYLPEKSVRVQAVTDLGAGFWLMTPLRQPGGAIVLINRGFVLSHQGSSASDRAACSDGPADALAPITVTGLLRISEPHGAFLHENDPVAGRWYSRDVQAIAQRQQLDPVAPYFIDADADPDPAQRNRTPTSDCPIGGLTVVNFPNSHLVYAVTWYALALMVAGALGWNALAQRRGIGSVKR
jgi:surfeit locus 1 family protein